MRTNGPGESALLLLDVIDVLDTFKIPYAVIGAMAASAHGVVRASVDADAILFIPPGDAVRKLSTQLEKIKLKTTLQRGGTDDPIGAVLSITDDHDNKVDLIINLQRFPADAINRRTQIQFLGSSLHFIGLEDFIAMKLFAAGPKDLEDVKNIVEIKKDQINRPLLEKLVAGFGKEPIQLLRKFL